MRADLVHELWKVHRVVRGVSALLFALTGAISQAAILTLQPASQIVRVGEEVRVHLVASEYSPGLSNPVAFFDFAFRFDVTALASTIEDKSTEQVFGAKLGSPGHEATAIWGVFEDVALNIVRVSEFSALSSSELATLQDTDSFLLATLYFEALSIGPTSIELLPTSNGIPFDQPTTVEVNVLPAPSTLVCLVLGLVFLCRRVSSFF